MRYSSPLIFLKFLQYQWWASNSKGHGIHSPFVFKLIQEQLNAKKTIELIEKESPIVQQVLEQIELATMRPLKQKIKRLIASLLERFNPSTCCVVGKSKMDASYETFKTIDFLFIGAGRSKALLLSEVAHFLRKMQPNSWMILEGIHADSDMEAAWDVLKKDTSIRLSIDLFHIGVLFCRSEQKEQEHFIIRY